MIHIRGLVLSYELKSNLTLFSLWVYNLVWHVHVLIEMLVHVVSKFQIELMVEELLLPEGVARSIEVLRLLRDPHVPRIVNDIPQIIFRRIQLLRLPLRAQNLRLNLAYISTHCLRIS